MFGAQIIGGTQCCPMRWGSWLDVDFEGYGDIEILVVVEHGNLEIRVGFFFKLLIDVCEFVVKTEDWGDGEI